MKWMILYAAIAFEVFGTAALKLSNGMQKPAIFAASLGLYAISFVLLSKSLQAMPIGMAYAVWSGVGTLMIILIGVFWFKEAMTIWHVIFMAMIIIGAIGLNLTASH
jgi:small multidrug resistance pump